MTVNAETLRQNNVQELEGLEDDRTPYPSLHCGCAPAHECGVIAFSSQYYGAVSTRDDQNTPVSIDAD
jgi:hypothetical protein